MGSEVVQEAKFWLMFFFKEGKDAEDFYETSKPPKLLGLADTVDYGLCYFVSLGRTANSLKELDEVSEFESKRARVYRSYKGTGSALFPTDVHGLITVIKSETRTGNSKVYFISI